jgi:hypothetical protein
MPALVPAVEEPDAEGARGLVELCCRETSSVCCVERQAQGTMSNSPMGVAEGEYEKACADWGTDPDKRDRRFRSVLVPQRNPRRSWIRDDAVEGDRTACISGQAGINGPSVLNAAATSVRAGE